jgi:hypothetical protein
MFEINKTGVLGLKYYPVVIEDYCQPNLAIGKEREKILDRL